MISTLSKKEIMFQQIQPSATRMMDNVATNATFDCQLSKALTIPLQENSTMACVHDQDLMLAHLYDLLSEEKSRELLKDIEESEASQQTMKQAQTKQALLQGWQDSPAPTGLAERTMARILRSTESISTGITAEIERPEQAL